MSDKDFQIADEDFIERKSVISEETISMIARMPEFDLLTREEVAHLAELEPHLFKRDEIIINSTDVGAKALVILLAGECRIEKSILLNGENVWVSIENMHAPAMLGEVGVFSSMPRTARVVSNNRSVVLLAPAETLHEHFTRSKATFPQMLWSFARLGLLRASAGAERYTKLYKENIDCSIAEDSGFTREIKRLQTLIGDKPGAVNVTAETIDDIAKFLDRVDYALAMIKFLDNMEDYSMPEDVRELDGVSATLTPLALAAIHSGDRRESSIKKSIVKICAKEGNYCGGAGDWTTCFELMIHAMEDLSRLARAEKERSYNRKIEPGSEAMILGFAERLEKELDDLNMQAVEKFKIEKFPEKLNDTESSNMLEDYLKNNMGKIMSRISLEDFETNVLSEYFRTGSDTRDSVAKSLYSKLSRHPVVMLLVPESCDLCDDTRMVGEREESHLLNFLCSGYQLLYPAESDDLGDGEDLARPYPV